MIAGCDRKPSGASQTPDPTLPGAQAPSPAIDRELRAALAAKGSSYRPRTRHLDAGVPRYVNRLIRETSPYLIQHAHNPVNWYAWGEEAFARAHREGRPIFLSVGYSTCHWCHVMERESFEDEEVARVLNASFICIKVDREERPDVDQVYMDAVQAMTGRGGWPMTAILAPDRKPFFGGTYFPRDRLLAILADVDARWRRAPGELTATGSEVAAHLAAA
ncbi:MAG: thioredoxin domain-containing protein, partial [Deltaproteobacteria bacterium]|nr:thioredoxin domain-containing protein [Deltaproteobacteria bacterium]